MRKERAVFKWLFKYLPYVFSTVALVMSGITVYMQWNIFQKQKPDLRISMYESGFSIFPQESPNFKMVAGFLVKNRGEKATTIYDVDANLMLPGCGFISLGSCFYIGSVTNSYLRSTAEIDAHQSVRLTCVFSAWRFDFEEENNATYGESVPVEYVVWHTDGTEIVNEYSFYCSPYVLEG